MFICNGVFGIELDMGGVSDEWIVFKVFIFVGIVDNKCFFIYYGVLVKGNFLGCFFCFEAYFGFELLLFVI